MLTAVTAARPAFSAGYGGTLVAQSNLWREMIVAGAKWDDGGGPSMARDPEG